jgi:hypothetical protein
MSAEDFTEDTEQEYFEEDGVTLVRQILNNVLMFAPEFGAFERLSIGPNQEWGFEYDSGVEGEDDAALRLLDQDGETVVAYPEPRQTASHERLTLQPEYDAIADVPSPDPDGPYAGEPANPRAIVRFTQTAADNEAAIDVPGLYSYSLAEAGWVRVDSPP